MRGVECVVKGGRKGAIGCIGLTHMQNTSHAVMAQRVEPKDSPDDFPTPPWATRALIEHIIVDKPALSAMTCLEPACGAGHMAKVFKEYFAEVRAADAFLTATARGATFSPTLMRRTPSIGSSPTRPSAWPRSSF